MLNMALIGVGRIGLTHAHTLKTMLSDKVNMRVFVDNVSSDLEKYASSYGTEHSRNIDEVLSDKNIDAVLICTPTNTHKEISLKALSAGKHVFCEKPISASVKEHLEVIEAVKSSGKKFMVGFNRRFDHNIKCIKERIDKGEIGKVQIIKTTNYDSPFPNIEFLKTSGGIYLDLCIHDFDTISFIISKTGDKVVDVFAAGSAFLLPALSEFGDVDTTFVTIKMESGAMACVSASRFATYGYDQRLEVLGTDGSLSCENDRPTNVTLSNSNGVQTDKPFFSFLPRYAEAYAREVYEFSEAVINDTDVPVSAEDCLPALKIALAATLSLKEKRIVNIDEIK